MAVSSFARLGKPDWRVLLALARAGRPLAPRELAADAKLALGKVAPSVKKLGGYGLAFDVLEDGKRKVRLEGAVDEGLREASNAFPGLPFERVFAGSRLGVFRELVLAPNQTKKELKERTGLSLPTLQRVLLDWKNRGLLTREKRRYRLRAETASLAKLVSVIYVAGSSKEIFGGRFQKILQTLFLADGRTLVVAEDESPPKGFYATAFDRFPDYGVNLLLTDKHYYANAPPSLEDVVIHTLAFFLPAGAVLDARTHDLLLELLRKNRGKLSENRLREKAGVLGVLHAQLVDALLREVSVGGVVRA